MAIDARNELFCAAAGRYAKATKQEKGQILDEICANSGLTRKHALRLLNKPPPVRKKRVRVRTRDYGELEALAMRRIWPLSGYLSSRRLVEALADIFEACLRHGEWVPEAATKALLLKMSASTCDRLLKPLRRVRSERGTSFTRPGQHLKAQIATRLGTEWDDAVPGFAEADLVGHSGPSPEGTFLFTLTLTDVATGWTELVGLKGKGQIEAVAAIGMAERRLPFKLLGLDTDNGSEFINYHLKAFCEDRKLRFTRSRPYVKNDGCRVEQKNGALVRRHIGYRRLDTAEQLCRLKEVYGVLRLLVNFFEPSAKLQRVRTDDGKSKKVYDKPTTPYRRVQESDDVDQEAKDRLETEFLKLNPVALRNRLKTLKRTLIDDELLEAFSED